MKAFSSADYKAKLTLMVAYLEAELKKPTQNWDDLEELIQTTRYMAEVIENWQIRQHELDPNSSLLQR